MLHSVVDLSIKLLVRSLKMEYFRSKFSMINHYTQLFQINWLYKIRKIIQLLIDAILWSIMHRIFKS